MSTIPASTFVNVQPSVLSAAGDAIDLNGLVLTNGNRVPIGEVLSFASAAAVREFFGINSAEDIVAGGGVGMGAGYFGGFRNSSLKPGALLFAQYNQSDVGAWLRGGDVSDLTLTELQAIAGTLSIVTDDATYSGTINLAAATGFSNAAALISDTLNMPGQQIAAMTAAISTTTLTVSAIDNAVLAVGTFIEGVGVTAGTQITALGSGTGGTGTYTVNNSQTVGSEAMTAMAPGVTYDSVRGAFYVVSENVGEGATIAFATGAAADNLKLQAAQGATISQGADAATPAGFMNGLIEVNTNWASFMTTFNPDESGNTNKLAFAAWASGQNYRFIYVCLDTDITATQSVPATGSLGYLIDQAEYSGTALIYSPTDLNQSAFLCGAIASINFEEGNGRITLAYKSQDGLLAGVTTQSAAINLGGNPQVADSFGNGYNYYGAVAAAKADFVFFQRGFISGDFRWIDSFANQIWLNATFQSVLLQFLNTIRSVPYNSAGYSLIEQALAGTIAQALSFGMLAPGSISSEQIVEVNQEAGVDIAETLQTQGWYLQILDASSAVRASRASPPMKFWYLDRGSVQAFNLQSIAVQ